MPRAGVGYRAGEGRGVEGRAHSLSLRHVRTPSQTRGGPVMSTQRQRVPASQHSFSKLSPALGTKASEVT